jgi:pimeloyl-ACP methyl ester carboxylesterase
VGNLLHRTARAVPGISRAEVDEVAQSITALADPGARDAFVHTVRNTLDLGGQRLNGLERLRLVSDAPLLLIAGRKDLCIPTEHTTRAHDACPGSRLELFPSAGHFPHRDQPLRFAQVVLDFLATTTASHTDLQDVRRRLRDTSDTATTTAA